MNQTSNTTTSNPHHWLEQITRWYEKHEHTIINELREFLSIPSVSTDSRFRDDVLECATFLKEYLQDKVGASTKLIPTQGFPIVYGELIHNPRLPSILIYGHYDVQPPDPLDQWNTPPFDPTIRNGAIYARGASDDKGQLWLLIQAIRFAIREQQLPCNIYFLLEGEEEIGSPALTAYLQEHALPAIDVSLVSDTSIPSENQPGITVSLRGIAYFQLDIWGPARDLHSGVYGGAVLNPATLLTHILNQIYDIHSGKIQIPNFYNDVIELTTQERTLLAKGTPPPEAFQQDTGLPPHAEQGYTYHESRTIRPSFDINGLWSGYQGEGSKTIIPASAHAKFSFRLVPNQNWQTIAQLVQTFIQSLIPNGIRYKLHTFHGGNPYRLPLNSPYYQLAEQAYALTFGTQPLPLYEGGSIPIVSLLAERTQRDVLLMGFGLPTDQIHAPNEHFKLHMLKRGIQTIGTFLYLLAHHHESQT